MIEQNSQIDNYVRKFKLVARRGVYSPLVILFLVIIAFHLLTLFRTPGPHVDESWNASRAWGFLQSGKNFGPLDSGVFDKFDGYWTFFPSLVTWIYSLFVKMIGPTLAAVRYTSLLFGCILLTIIYFLVSLIYDRNIGLLSIFLVAVSSSFLFSSHLGRQDIIVAVFAYSAFSFYLVDKSQRFSLLSIISGLLASLAFEVHPPIGVIVIPSLGILYILDNGISFIRLKRFWGFAAGSVVGFVFYAFLHIIPYPQTYFQLMQLLAPWRSLPILTLSPSLWFKSILDLSLLINQFEKFYIPIIFLAAISLLIRHLPSDKKLLKLLFAVIVSFILLVRYKLSFYAIIITPLLGIIIAVLLDMSWHFITNKIPKFKIPLKITAFITMGLIIFYLFIAIAFDLSPVLTDASSSYNTVLTTINQIVPDGKIVMGPQTYWFGRVGQPYYTWEQIVFYQRYAPGVNLEEAFEQFRPQFFIIDKHLDSFIADSVSDLSEHHQFLYLSKTELEQFLYNHGILVKTIKTSNFGLIRIYRLTWP